MAESEIKNASIALYDHLCQNIVGSEDHVKTLRMMNNVRDNLQSNETFSCITSGSFGEGLDMRGSDFDIMVVLKEIEILEDKHMYLNADKTHFTMELEDTQPGFTKLLLEHSNDPSIRIFCVEIGDCNQHKMVSKDFMALLSKHWYKWTYSASFKAIEDAAGAGMLRENNVFTQIAKHMVLEVNSGG
ncbi:unnamed protein product [Mytilus edulis]|uniref:Uncharacterized protein n=1 Tax=Mytilus edulis TaxID=6550 RepID=A0A8S3RHC9_MYTED|nr:unnamed protein product [Mytilus edulis]